jgi:hypothetical protein
VSKLIIECVGKVTISDWKRDDYEAVQVKLSQIMAGKDKPTSIGGEKVQALPLSQFNAG